MREACKFIEGSLAVPVDSLGRDALMSAARTAMSSKIVGAVRSAGGGGGGARHHCRCW